MKKRIKPAGFSTAEEYTTAVLAVSNFEAALRELKAQRDLKLHQIAAEFDQPIAAIENQMANMTMTCARYADGHRAQLFGEQQSASSRGVRHGFRKGPPKLETLAKFTWAKVLAKLQSLHLADYIRLKPEVNKEAILEHGKGGTIAIEENGGKIEFPLSEVGVKITQTEEYFIEPRSDAAETVKAQEAAA